MEIMSIHITPELRARLVAAAKSKRISMSLLVRDALDAFLEPAPVSQPTPPMPRAKPVRATTRWCTPRQDSLRSREG